MALAKAQTLIPPIWGTRTGFPLRLIAASTGLVFFMLLLLLDSTHVYLSAFSPSTHNHPPPLDPDTLKIPNHLHFVYLLPDPETSDFTFQFSHFLALFSAHHHWRPTKITLHTNAPSNGTAITRAGAGAAGKWARLILTHFNTTLSINTVPTPTHAGNGVELVNMEHRSDFVRVRALHDMGGVYIDWDVHALRGIRALLDSGFRGLVGREQDGNELLTGIVERLGREEGRC
ncbi:hypothetical protein N0V88_002135 [Collariella sp. IMI 366227]|nr:hypothetical protein N0V88_002135 [Collariella sp. IMI 366227]